MNLHCVTLTGADESVAPKELAALASDFPFVEIGILLCHSFAGKKPAYPDLDWVQRLCHVAAGGNAFALSGHLCGTWASEPGRSGSFSFPDEHPTIWAALRRVQLNRSRFGGKARPDLLAAALQSHPGRPFIFQVTGAESLELLQRWRTAGLNALPLFDRSGGRGRRPAEWPTPVPGLLTGYAGGLSPDTLAHDLDQIAAVAGDASVWVDMQSSLRSADGGFDLGRARAALAAAQAWMARKQAPVHSSNSVQPSEDATCS